MEQTEKYINPFTDYGFKRLFGEEPNKDLLIDFLNEVLKGKETISDLTYLKTEKLGPVYSSRKAVFDLYCENEKGEKFIVELQKAKQKFFKDRSVFYSTFPIREQAVTGDWDFELKAVYTIGILDFVFDENKDNKDYFHWEVKLMETTKKTVFYDKLTYIYLELPKFDKPLEMIETHFEKWLYILRNLNKLDRLPDKLREHIFEKLFAIAEIAGFSTAQLNDYEDSLKELRDMYSVMKTQREEGREEKSFEMAKSMKADGFNNGIIAKHTGLTINQIEKLC